MLPVVRANPLAENPYEAPLASSTVLIAPRNLVGGIGLFVSLMGFMGVVVVGPLGPIVSSIGMRLAFLCLPGLLVSVIGVFRKPRRLAAWGVALGVIGSLYLPTFYLSIFVFPYR